MQDPIHMLGNAARINDLLLIDVIAMAQQSSSFESNLKSDEKSDTTIERPYEWMEGYFNDRQTAWKHSPMRSRYLDIIDSRQPTGGWQIKEAVIIASGSLCDGATVERTVNQIVVFVDTIEHVQQSSNEKIQAFAEEIAYSAADIEFLATLGIEARNNKDTDDRIYANDTTIWPWSWPTISTRGLLTFECCVTLVDDTILRQLLRANSTLHVGADMNEAYQWIMFASRWHGYVFLDKRGPPIPPEVNRSMRASLDEEWKKWMANRTWVPFPTDSMDSPGLEELVVYTCNNPLLADTSTEETSDQNLVRSLSQILLNRVDLGAQEAKSRKNMRPESKSVGDKTAEGKSS